MTASSEKVVTLSNWEAKFLAASAVIPAAPPVDLKTASNWTATFCDSLNASTVLKASTYSPAKATPEIMAAFLNEF